jgi:hypothetical protein
MTHSTENDVARVLREHGLSDRPDQFDSSIHSWRCEHPDRYGPCSCFADLVADLTRVIPPEVGDYVTKPKGYPYPGWIVSVFTNRAGDVRLVVESELAPGMLHIFAPTQVTRVIPPEVTDE